HSTRPRPPTSPLVPYATLFRSEDGPPPGEEVGMVGVFGPGETVYRAFDLTPGDYVAVCFIPDYLGDGAPHLMHGMIQAFTVGERSEEHTSELQSREKLVCRLLL